MSSWCYLWVLHSSRSLTLQLCLARQYLSFNTETGRKPFSSCSHLDPQLTLLPMFLTLCLVLDPLQIIPSSKVPHNTPTPSLAITYPCWHSNRFLPACSVDWLRTEQTTHLLCSPLCRTIAFLIRSEFQCWKGTLCVFLGSLLHPSNTIYSIWRCITSRW